MNRQSAARPDMTRQLQRGTARCLSSLGYGVISEMSLPNGARADLVGLSANGEILIVEIKSCLQDYQSDRKWQLYRDYCDQLLFAVASDFPDHVLPEDAGLIIADAYGGAILRKGSLAPVATARRKAMMIAFARLAAGRLQLQLDPGATGMMWIV